LKRIDPTLFVGAVIFTAFAVLLLTRLGHYTLWDDEANTALFADGVWRTGDTSAAFGNNVVAYRNGLELDGLKNRRNPPLSYFVAAPFVGLLGRSALAARLPFALLSLATLGVAIAWLRKSRAELQTWVLFGLAILGNVSLMLYGRLAPLPMWQTVKTGRYRRSILRLYRSGR
jgi:4-amino-4-deoxy-L-arabinose transferase-like glycosyltransferase